MSHAGTVLRPSQEEVSMRWLKVLVLSVVAIAGAMFLVVVGDSVSAQTPAGQRPTLFEGARLIVGDGSAPIERSAFVVQGNRLAAVGRAGEVQAPAGAARVDLSGKTVMPAF